MHRFVEQRAGNVDVAAERVERTIRRHEAVAGGMRLQLADVEVHLLRQTKTVAANLDQLAGRHERLDVTFERGALVARNLENLQQLTHAGGMVDPLAHQREDLIG